jgi:hypothetical protein
MARGYGKTDQGPGPAHEHQIADDEDGASEADRSAGGIPEGLSGSRGRRREEEGGETAEDRSESHGEFLGLGVRRVYTCHRTLGT